MFNMENGKSNISQSMIDLRSVGSLKTTNKIENKKSCSEKVKNLLSSFENLPENKKNITDFAETLLKNGEQILFIEREKNKNEFSATISIKDFLTFTEFESTKIRAITKVKQQFFNYIKSIQKLIQNFKKSKYLY